MSTIRKVPLSLFRKSPSKDPPNPALSPLDITTTERKYDVGRQMTLPIKPSGSAYASRSDPGPYRMRKLPLKPISHPDLPKGTMESGESRAADSTSMKSPFQYFIKRDGRGPWELALKPRVSSGPPKQKHLDLLQDDAVTQEDSVSESRSPLNTSKASSGSGQDLSTVKQPINPNADVSVSMKPRRSTAPTIKKHMAKWHPRKGSTDSGSQPVTTTKAVPGSDRAPPFSRYPSPIHPNTSLTPSVSTEPRTQMHLNQDCDEPVVIADVSLLDKSIYDIPLSIEPPVNMHLDLGNHDDAASKSRRRLRMIRSTPSTVPDLHKFRYPRPKDPGVPLSIHQRVLAEAHWLGVSVPKLVEMKRVYRAKQAKKQQAKQPGRMRKVLSSTDDEGFDELAALKELQELARQVPWVLECTAWKSVVKSQGQS